MLSPGDTFDRYRVERLLGQGGWGRVYEAFDTRLRRKVALKVLGRGRAGERARFLREARAAAALPHVNVVSVFDVGEAEGRAYIAMELVEGRLLAEIAGPGTVPVSQKVAWLKDVARVLETAHAGGLVHRDVKPQNVMVTPSGVVKVLDFGLAKGMAEDRPGPPSEAEFSTAEGTVVGTPRYMAPEALRGEALDGRADQYSWGVMAYELLSGRDPRAGQAYPVGDKVPRLLSEFEPEVPFGLAAVIARTLATAPQHRFPDMPAVIAALEAVPSFDPALASTERSPQGMLAAQGEPPSTARERAQHDPQPLVGPPAARPPQGAAPDPPAVAPTLQSPVAEPRAR